MTTMSNTASMRYLCPEVRALSTPCRVAAIVLLSSLLAIAQETSLFIPLEYGFTARVWRGNNTPPSHTDIWNRFAFDFSPLPVGTPVHAADSGTVVLVKVTTEGPTGDWRDNNQIAILHDNSHVSLYEHLKKDGAAVKCGQKVLAGDIIGWSGNTGNSEEPHLHFVIRKWNGSLGEAVPCRFADIPGNGLPITGDIVTSGNFAIRRVVGEFVCLMELYAFVGSMDAREVLRADIQRAIASGIPAAVRAIMADVKSRPDLTKLYIKWRDTLRTLVISDKEAVAARLRLAQESRDDEQAFRIAYLGLRDFPVLERDSIFSSVLHELRRIPKSSDYERALASELHFRRILAIAVQEEITYFRTKAKGLYQSPQSMLRAYATTSSLELSGERKALLDKHVDYLRMTDWQK